MKRQKNRFTLLELVIITVCSAMLLGLTVSAAGNASARAKNVLCTNVLNHIGKAVHAYADDNKGFVPCRVRDPKTGGVVDFGPNLSVWGNKLIGGGYYGPKPAGRYDSWIGKEKMTRFVCPEDVVVYKKSPGNGSYYIFSINEIVAVQSKRYGGEEYSRVLVTRDRPENAICFDGFPYRGGVLKTSTHGDTSNVLRLGGNVSTVNIKKAAKAANIWNWIGEFMDGIELK